jgi:hypothetical protein
MRPNLVVLLFVGIASLTVSAQILPVPESQQAAKAGAIIAA